MRSPISRPPSLLPRILFSLLALAGLSPGAPPQGAWVNLASDGRLLYQRDALGNRVPDFGDCGYRAGREAIPTVPVRVTVGPVDGDDRASLQAAIDQVSALPRDASGFRGAVLLRAGEYQLDGTLTIGASGVVLRGAGDSETGTRLRATAPRQYTLLKIAGSGTASTISGTTRGIVDKYVPVGSRSFTVDGTDGLAVGSKVRVFRPSTQPWLDALGMNQLKNPWKPGSRDILWDRVITRIEGRRVFIDAPLTTALEARYGGGSISAYAWPERIEQCGIEGVRGISDSNGTATDEAHAWNFITLEKAEHCWVRNVTSQFFGNYCVGVLGGAKWVSVLDSQSLDPVSLVTGGRRYAFHIDDGQLSLVRNCYTREDRHQYVTGSGTPGPNAFVSSSSDNARNDAGPHHRWADGILWDRITVNGNDLDVQNRGNLGSGHGWAGGNCVVWNSRAQNFVVQNPPTARNWLIGSIGTIKDGRFWVGPHDPGTYDAHGAPVFPATLYGNQRQDLQQAPGLEVREYVVGDFDEFANDAGDESVPVDAAWQAEITRQGRTGTFDSLQGGRWVAWTHTFHLSPGERILSATLHVSLRGLTDRAVGGELILDSLENRQPLSRHLGAIATTGSTMLRLDLADDLARLADGRLNLAIRDQVAVDWSVLELRVAPAAGGNLVTRSLLPEAAATGGNGTFTLQEDAKSTDQRRALLQWDLAGATGKVVHAKIRLTPVRVGRNDLENALVWVAEKEPPKPDAPLASWHPILNTPAEIVVTSEVRAALATDGKLSVQLSAVRDTGAESAVDYASREHANAAYRPQLILTLEEEPKAAIRR